MYKIQFLLSDKSYKFFRLNPKRSHHDLQAYFLMSFLWMNVWCASVGKELPRGSIYSKGGKQLAAS